MDRLPRIGERVHYRSARIEGYEATGIVRKIYEGFEEDTLAVIPVGSGGWSEHWHACVEVDERPDWWGYSDNVFAPPIAEIEPA
jgi:hypothetical protein